MDSAPVPTCHTQPGNNNKHPANILFETGVIQKRHTRKEKAADNKCIMEAKATQQKAVQKGVQHLVLMEMEVEAKVSKAKTKKAKPPLHPHTQAPTSESKELGGGGSKGVESEGDGSYTANSVSNTQLS